MISIKINKQQYKCKVAKTKEETTNGMIGKFFTGFDGLYFDLGIGRYSFHTSGCIIPMDIVFIKDGKVVKVYPNCPPNSQKLYTYYGDAVLELPANTVFKDKIILMNSVSIIKEL